MSKCNDCFYDQFYPVCCLCGSDNRENFKPKETVMSDKFCPAGKIECEDFSIRGNYISNFGSCHRMLTNNSGEVFPISAFEQCPWPSKQKKVKDKYEKAWGVFYTKMMESAKKTFIDCCKLSELK